MKYVIDNPSYSIFELMEEAAPVIAAYGVGKKIDVDVKNGCLTATFSPLSSYMGRLDREELEDAIRDACLAHGKFNRYERVFGFTINGTEVAIATDKNTVDCIRLLKDGDTMRKNHGVNFFTLSGSFPGKVNIGFVTLG